MVFVSLQPCVLHDQLQHLLRMCACLQGNIEAEQAAQRKREKEERKKRQEDERKQAEEEAARKAEEEAAAAKVRSTSCRVHLPAESGSAAQLFAQCTLSFYADVDVE